MTSSRSSRMELSYRTSVSVFGILHNSDAVSVFFSWTYLCLYLYSHRAREIFGYPRLPDEPWEKTLIWEDDD